MTNQEIIAGAGGSKSGASGRQAKEARDSLISVQNAVIVEAIAEGEIEGLVDGLKSVYLNETPIVSSSGTPNFEGVGMAFFTGSQTQIVDDQAYLMTAPGKSVEVAKAVEVEVHKNSPVTRTVTTASATWAKVIIGTPQLTEMNTSNGDLGGATVEYQIQVQSNGGGFVTQVEDKFSGKTTSLYRRQHKIFLPGEGPWDIRVIRVTPDSDKSTLQNKIFWKELIEGVDVKLSYPNTAIASLLIDSTYFNSIPTRAYEIRGLRVRVPVNYDPATRTYTGVWNGNFKIAWTDNPAWCFYDLVTNKRYGLGEFLENGQIDKWALYSIAQYCDELVPDGFGGTEPRFTCNLYLQAQEDAFKVLNNMASIFRALIYYADGQISVTQDSPQDPVALYSAANVIDGMFNYHGADRRARHTVALVSWNDPADMYRQKIEYVDDPDGIDRWGVLPTEILAFGCTSRGQARRLGKWLLYTEQHESEVVTFRAGLDAAFAAPGCVIAIQDAVKSGRRLGGRLKASTLSALTLDAPITIEDGQSYEITVVMPDGTLATRGLLNGAGAEQDEMLLASPLPELPVPAAMWVVASSGLVPELWRVISIVESEPTIVEITALRHDTSKFGYIEQNLDFDSIPTSAIKTRPGPVTNLTATNELYRVNDAAFSVRIALSWIPPESAGTFSVVWRRENETEHFEETKSPVFDIENVSAGKYFIKVVPVNKLGIRGDPVSIEHIVTASGTAPNVQNLVLNPNFAGKDLPVKWDQIDSAVSYKVEVRTPDGATLLRAENVFSPDYTYTFSKNLADGGPRRSLTLRVRAVTLQGESADWTQAIFANQAPAAPASVALEAGPGQVSIFAERPGDEDLAGMIVWKGSNSGVSMIDANKVYEGTDNAFVKSGLQPGIPAYFKVAFYDHFGKVGLNASSVVSATPTAAGGVVIVEELPDSPADVAGELAVFLDVESASERGMYGWNGTEWVNVRDLLDGSVGPTKIADDAIQTRHVLAGAVTAQKMAVSEISAISANLGTMTAGNFTLNSAGFIRGGATNYTSGTGFWAGYDAGFYKIRVGIPGSSRMEWSGTAFNVYDAAGNLTISSGIVDFSKLMNKPASLADISSTEGSKLAGIQTGATRNVFRGLWTTGMTMEVGDSVTYAGSSWVSKIQHTSAVLNAPPEYPVTSNTWWQLVAAKGSDASYITSVATQLDFANETEAIDVNGDISLPFGRGHALVHLNPSTGAASELAMYDTYNNIETGDIVDLIQAIDAIPSGNIVILSSIDATQVNQALRNALKTCGSGIEDIWTPSRIAHAFIGVKGAPEGTAYEKFASGAANVSLTGYYTPSGLVLNGAKGESGTNAVIAILSNEAHTFPASHDGVVSDYAGSGTEIHVYDGTSELAYDGVGTAPGRWKVTTAVTNIIAGGLTDAGNHLVVGSHSGVSAGADTSSVIFTITGKTQSGNSFTLVKSQSFTKSKAGTNGAAGPAGPAVLVSSSRSLAFTATDGTLDAGQANITFNAQVSGITSPTYVWTFSGFQTAPSDSGTSALTVTQAQFGSSKAATVTCTVNGVYKDVLTIVRLEKSTAAAGATVGAEIGVNLAGKITPANVSTFIENGAISNAYIGNVIQSTSYDEGSNSGWKIDKTGSIRAFNIYARGDIQASSIKADVIDIVKTAHIEGDAIIVPRRGAFYQPYDGSTQSARTAFTLNPIMFEAAARVVIFLKTSIRPNGGVGPSGGTGARGGFILYATNGTSTVTLFDTGNQYVYGGSEFSSGYEYVQEMMTIEHLPAAGTWTYYVHYRGSLSNAAAAAAFEATLFAVKK